ncbi:hypothetical protein ACQY0O_006449 [Thecaphora frezii]
MMSQHRVGMTNDAARFKGSASSSANLSPRLIRPFAASSGWMRLQLRDTYGVGLVRMWASTQRVESSRVESRRISGGNASRRHDALLRYAGSRSAGPCKHGLAHQQAVVEPHSVPWLRPSGRSTIRSGLCPARPVRPGYGKYRHPPPSKLRRRSLVVGTPRSPSLLLCSPSTDPPPSRSRLVSDYEDRRACLVLLRAPTSRMVSTRQSRLSAASPAKPPLIHLPTPPEIATIPSPLPFAIHSKPVIPRRPVLERSKSSKKCSVHPYLSGNYAPVTFEHPLTDCLFQGTIPAELAGCQYVRNGGNPMANSEMDRDAHWFDADGMLAGVLFRRLDDGSVQPSFLNRYILTDLVLSTPERSRFPLLPSIATLVNPRAPLLGVLLAILRTVVLALLTWLPGLGLTRKQKLKRIGAANTSIYWHDGKAMAGCESGPPMRVMLPGLETVGWWTGQEDTMDAEPAKAEVVGQTREEKKWKKKDSTGWGSGPPILSMLREFTTAHPRVDPVSGELLLYHMCFEPPFLRVTVIPATGQEARAAGKAQAAPIKELLGAPVRGLSQPKMMHDFGATRTRTVILDLPLSLDIMNMAKGKPILHYDPTKPSRFGIFPRHRPDRVRWYESPEACCVFHTANSWDGDEDSVNMLGCRLNSATLVYSAGNLLPPSHVLPAANCPEKCQLYYWRFQNEPEEAEASAGIGPRRRRQQRGDKLNIISHEFALSDIPFEFPSINPQRSLQEARYVYGTSLKDGTFDAGLAKAAKIDCLVKIDAKTLIRRGKQRWSRRKLARGESVDTRTVVQVLEQQRAAAEDADRDTIQVFEMPRGWYAQEATFVPRARRAGEPEPDEDDGWLMCYVFDELTGLHPTSGEVLPDATSELWIIDAKGMKDVVCRIKLPQRVPYGLHGTLFTEQQIANQKPVPASQIRSWADSINNHDPFSPSSTSASFQGSVDLKRSSEWTRSRSEMYEAFLQDPIRIGAWWVKRTVEGWIA